MTVTEVFGAALSGRRRAQSAGSSPPRAAMASMSLDWFIVTTSASRPSMTDRACLLEPPCDCSRRTSSPVLFFQSRTKAMRVPSGEKAGQTSLTALLVRFRCSLPSGFIK